MGMPVTVTTEIAVTVQLNIRAVQIKVISPSRGAFDWTEGRLHRVESGKRNGTLKCQALF